MELFLIVVFILLIGNFVIYKKDNIDAKDHSFIFADSLGYGLLTSSIIVIILENDKISGLFYLFPLLFIVMIYIGYIEKEIYKNNKENFNIKVVLKNIIPIHKNKCFRRDSLLKISILLIFNAISGITIFAFVNPDSLYLCVLFLVILSSILLALQFKNKITGINF